MKCIDGSIIDEIKADKYVEYDLGLGNTKTIKCTSIADPGFEFDSWKGDFTPVNAKEPTQELKPVQYGTINAIFIKKTDVFGLDWQTQESVYILIAAIIGHAILIPFIERWMRKRENKHMNKS
jgi:hypothetical protein